MSQRTLNLGIVAHVDAGKTTLTERLLHAAGVIEEVGSVDDGTTQTDSLELERQRGITIKSAVVSFTIGDVTVNLIDTPGHPDFIAEVERALAVLDGAVLVVSAVEGVQPQTRLLMRALQRLRLPTIIFVNKVDRVGANEERVLDAVRRRLTSSVVPMGTVHDIGTRTASVVPFGDTDGTFIETLTTTLAEHDEALLEGLTVAASGPSVATNLLRALRRQSRRGLVHPVFFGSALMGIGLEPFRTGLADLLPATCRDPDVPAAGTVFKIERTRSGERQAYVRLFRGSLAVRDRVGDDKVTAVRVFHEGGLVDRSILRAGEIGKLSGLRHARIGDAIGLATHHGGDRGAAGDLRGAYGQAKSPGAALHFARPTLATVVVPVRPEDAPRLVTALSDLAEQDPLIGVRHDALNGELSLSLYGEVQREVIAATLQSEFGIGVSCRGATPLYVERPAGTGEAEEVLYRNGNPFQASIGLRVEAGMPDSGVGFAMEVDPRTTPLYLYQTFENFASHLEGWVRETLREGIRGWEVTDCVVTVIRCQYSSPDGPPSRNGPLSTPADFRHLTPIVTMEALRAAGTWVCEPLARVSIEVPREQMALVMTALGNAEAEIEGVETASAGAELSEVRAVLPSERALHIQRALPDLTRGEGVMEQAFGGRRRIRCAAGAEPPVRRRSTVDPLDRQSYLASLGMSMRFR